MKNDEQRAYDPLIAKEFVKKFFQIQNEKKMLSEDEKALKEEYKGKVPVALVKKVMQYVKIKKQLEYEAASEDTIDSIEDIITDNFVTVG